MAEKKPKMPTTKDLVTMADMQKFGLDWTAAMRKKPFESPDKKGKGPTGLAAMDARRRRRKPAKSSPTSPLPKPKPKDSAPSLPKPKPKRTIESMIKELGLDKPSRKPVSAPKPKPQQGLKRRQSNIDKEDRKTSLSAARRAGHLYYWQNGKKMAAVTQEDLKESGLGLTAFMNMQLGKTARKPKKAPAKVKTGASQYHVARKDKKVWKGKKSPPKKKSTEIKEMTPSTSRGLGSLASRRRKSKPAETPFRKGGLLYGGKK